AMSYLKLVSSSLFLIFTLFTMQAQAVEEIVVPSTTPTPSPAQVKGQPMIITPVPSAKEMIATPDGFVNCFTVEAGWYKNAWVPEHRVCQYQNVPGQSVTYEGVAWVEGYWSCTGYMGATCTKWEWKSGHWVKTLEVY